MFLGNNWVWSENINYMYYLRCLLVANHSLMCPETQNYSLEQSAYVTSVLVSIQSDLQRAVWMETRTDVTLQFTENIYYNYNCKVY